MWVLAIINMLWTIIPPVCGRGLLLLYRPVDISTDCAMSQHLRYDLSFGMGMSDTITLVFRTLTEIDYECGVEITTDYKDPRIEIVVVIRYPNSLAENCGLNPNAFSVIKKDLCIPICSRVFTRDMHAPFFTFSTVKKVRFRFVSNSSINTDMNAFLYEVTATSARRKLFANESCNPTNETNCSIGPSSFCFTSGVVCDGINNCGVADWFDERKSECELPIPTLGYTPVIAIMAALLCAMLALVHVMLKCLPPLANSFFIFNANEDNRLRINPLFKVSDSQADHDKDKRDTLIPVSSSSSELSDADKKTRHGIQIEATLAASEKPPTSQVTEDQEEGRTKTAMKIVTATIHKKLMAVSGRSSSRAAVPDIFD